MPRRLLLVASSLLLAACASAPMPPATYDALILSQKDSLGLEGKCCVDLAKLASTIQAGLKEQAGVEAQVDCGGKFREAEAGKSFDCKATDAGGAAHTVTITVKDKAGNVDWKLAGGGEEPPAEE